MFLPTELVFDQKTRVIAIQKLESVSTRSKPGFRSKSVDPNIIHEQLAEAQAVEQLF